MRVKTVFTAVPMLAALAGAAHRVMVIEDVTATWCTYCPGAARGADELKFRAFDSVVVIGYHASTSDPFYTSTAAARKSFYGITGYPSVVLDGSNTVVGGLHTGTMYPVYRQYYDYRATLPSPLEIDLAVSYDSTGRTGTLDIAVRNIGGSSVNGQLHTALIESHIYYPWQGMDSLQDVERTMLPNASGEAIAVPAGDSVTKTRDFSVNSAWVAHNCEFVVFVQDNSTREMYQGARTAVMPEPALDYLGYQPVFPMPDSLADLTVGLRNIGSAPATGLSAVLATDDPHVTVTGATASFPDIECGQDGYSTTPFTVDIAPGCPDPHLATMTLAITSAADGVDTMSFPLNITAAPGLVENMEFGPHGWTHDGIRDGWHLSEYRSSSPTHAWYCGLEYNHQYSDENDARLMTPFFTVGDSAMMNFRHWYQTENGCDFCAVEINTGSLFWRPLALYHGSAGGWTLAELDLSAFRGQTVQARFRFISDYRTTDEGWYIDDFWCSALTGVAEPAVPVCPELSAGDNPVRISALVRYALPQGCAGALAVYDAAGRRVRVLGPVAGTGSVVWDLADGSGRPVRTGSYFVRLTADETSAATMRITVAR